MSSGNTRHPLPWWRSGCCLVAAYPTGGTETGAGPRGNGFSEPITGPMRPGRLGLSCSVEPVNDSASRSCPPCADLTNTPL